MASKTSTVWALDIGNNSLKALHLSNERGVVEVIGFDNIQHGKILTGTGVTATEKDELIAISLRRFVEQNDLSKDDIVVSMPSQNSFARFVSLPPVEPKRIPEIVKFEAAQQIPFDINDVQWDWQLMTQAGSSETKVGIFAIKNDVVDYILEHLSRENVKVNYVQMAPMALYNYVLYDRPEMGASENQAIVALDIGAENTDLVVCTPATVWQRCIPMGGNAFTRAIADAFKLSFERAEKLKRTAPMSKYARQVFQAMRPVFTDLASEIQRSLNFYSNSNPNAKLLRVIALGGGTKMRGLLKYLRQTLQVPVERPDSFKKLAIGSGVSAPKLHENVPDFAIVYGLALQALGLGRIDSNLLPRSVARSMTWAGKAKYFTAAACMLLLASLMCLARTSLDRVNYSKNDRYRQKTSSVIEAANQAERRLREEESKGSGLDQRIRKAFEPFGYRDVLPLLHETIITILPNEKNNPAQKDLYRAFAVGEVEKVKEIPRRERKQVFVTGMSVQYVEDVAIAPLGQTALVSGSTRKQKEAAEKDYEDERYYAEARMGGEAPKYGQKQYLTGEEAQGAVVEEVGSGFVVTIEGYSPYKDIGELMDPIGVEGEPAKWGVITRLLHLDDIVDGNSPFKLYKKLDTEHFKLEAGEVNLEGDMPQGIGVVDVRPGTAKAESTGYGTADEKVLLDPMTKEIISKVPKYRNGRRIFDRVGKVDYEVNDHWFVLKFKLIWKDAPNESGSESGGAASSGATAGARW
ncbi:MAG TPA: type IV pilus assembly protein PilM [Sedimentisphaerales bacterium]|nr:type IV pilus assembly protein PilM [Sedimentisphaerales bacterium]